jgi:UrcA family protein
MMNRFVRSASAAASWALVALPIVALAGAVHAADGVKIRYGDLADPAQAASFERQVNSAANHFCRSGGKESLSYVAACKSAVRDEAMSQLSPSQRVQVSMAQAARPSAS